MKLRVQYAHVSYQMFRTMQAKFEFNFTLNTQNMNKETVYLYAYKIVFINLTMNQKKQLKIDHRKLHRHIKPATRYVDTRAIRTLYRIQCLVYRFSESWANILQNRIHGRTNCLVAFNSLFLQRSCFFRFKILELEKIAHRSELKRENVK